MNLVPNSSPTEKPIRTFWSGENTFLGVSRFLKTQERDTEDQMKRIILVTGCTSESIRLISRCFKRQDQFEIINVNNFDVIHEVLNSVHPDLIIIGASAWSSDRSQLLIELEFASSDIPLVLVSDSKLSATDRNHLLSDGAIDCLDIGIGEEEFGLRLRVALFHRTKLDGYRKKVDRIEAENKRLIQDYENLKQEATLMRRESIAHLELLIHSKGVKDSLLDKLYDLKPYLNLEGKSKLNHIAKQMKWEISDEEELNLERQLDDNHHTLFELLDRKSAGITRYEKRLCAYFLTNQSSAVIARLARKNSNCINVAFARIRSKLGVRSNKELHQYLEDLVASDSRKEVFMSPVL